MYKRKLSGAPYFHDEIVMVYGTDHKHFGMGDTIPVPSFFLSLRQSLSCRNNINTDLRLADAPEFGLKADTYAIEFILTNPSEADIGLLTERGLKPHHVTDDHIMAIASRIYKEWVNRPKTFWEKVKRKLGRKRHGRR